MLQPWRNSSFEFILMSGSRLAILTPSFAFLLCGLEKNWINFIWKWAKIGTTIAPLCFSTICFHNGEFVLFFSTSLIWLAPRLKRFFPVSPAYVLVKPWSPQILQSIWYPAPVFLQTPSFPELHGKQLNLWQFLDSLLPGTVKPRSWASLLPPLSWIATDILLPFNSSAQIFFISLARMLFGVGGMMMTPSLTFEPLFSFL